MNGGVTLEGGKFEIAAVGEEPTSPLTTVPAPVEPVTARVSQDRKLLHHTQRRGCLGQRHRETAQKRGE